MIDQALKDALRSAQSLHGHDARGFLSGSSMLYYWCEVAGFDPTCVIALAKALMAGGADPRADAWKQWAEGRQPGVRRLAAEPASAVSSHGKPGRHASGAGARLASS